MSDRTCGADDCERHHTRRGLCEMHYRRLMNHGSTADPRPAFEQRFWAKVKVGAPDECWEWQGASLVRGYGVLSAPERTAHRTSWVLANGPIPDGLWVLHRCDNPPCVNPSHLWLGTVVDNTRDMDAKGRRVTVAKLTLEQVAEVQALQGTATQRELGERFGVSESAIRRAIRRAV